MKNVAQNVNLFFTPHPPPHPPAHNVISQKDIDECQYHNQFKDFFDVMITPT